MSRATRTDNPVKLYGSIAELVAAVFRKDSNNITLRPSQSVTYTQATDIQLPPEVSTPQVLVSADSTQTLTNKTLSGASNTITNISLTSQVTGVLPAANGGTGVANSNTLTYGANNITLTTGGVTALTLPTSGTLATLSGSETFNNKVIANTSSILIKDNSLTLQDDGDTTKTVQFQLSGITTGTQRTLTVPDSSITLLGRADTATVSNKSLDNTNTVVLLDSGFILESAGDTTKSAKFSLTSISTATQRTLTIPDANLTIVGTTTTQTLTNKTIDASANTVTNVSLTTGVTGTLPLGNGGTGQTSKTAAYDGLSPSTTKGDITVHNGTNNVRLGVGADGTVLTADSTQTTGLKYSSVLTNPMTSVGDIIVGGTAGAATRLAIGASGTVLHGGTTPSYSQIVNADVSASAAIDFSKLATLSSANILVGSAGNVATSTAVTGDVTISNTGVTAIGSSTVTSAMIVDGTIVNADINASAAIDGSKLVAATGSLAGAVSTTTQTFGGVKTFTNGVKLAGGDTLNSYVAPVSFTPTLTSSNNNLNITSSIATGMYSRIGDMVTATIHYAWNNVTAVGTGYFKFTLPFTLNSTTNINPVGSVSASNMTLDNNYTYLNLVGDPGTNFVYLQQSAINGQTFNRASLAAGNASTGVTREIIGTITFYV